MILTVTLNAAIDKRYVVEEFRVGEVNRIKAVSYTHLIERRNDILERLQAEKRVVVSELSVIYQVSEETIRRDLEKLENDGLVIKSYGGAVLNEHSIFDLPFNIRKNQDVYKRQPMIQGLQFLRFRPMMTTMYSSVPAHGPCWEWSGIRRTVRN